jgi:hypothetical protein
VYSDPYRANSIVIIIWLILNHPLEAFVVVKLLSILLFID